MEKAVKHVHQYKDFDLSWVSQRLKEAAFIVLMALASFVFVSSVTSALGKQLSISCCECPCNSDPAATVGLTRFDKGRDGF